MTNRFLDKSYKALFLCTAILLNACATAYGPRGFTGGYSDEKIDENTYIVAFNGNGNTSEQRVWNFWMYRCAELTLSKGYEFFSITPLKKTSQISPLKSDGKPYEFTMLKESENLAQRFKKDGFYATYYVTVTTYSSRAKVDMYNKPVPDEVKFILDAKTVTNILDEYVKSNGEIDKLPGRKDLLLRAAFEAGVKLGRIRKKQESDSPL